jgi:histone H3/H4
MRSILPDDAQVAKKSKQCMVDCAAEFISFVTSEASYYCRLNQRNTITAEDLIDAMRRLGLDVIADYSFRYYQHYRNHDHAFASGQYAPLPPPLPQAVQARASGQYYAPPPPPPPTLPLQDVQARNFPMAPNFKFPNQIEMGTFFGVDDEVLPPPPLPQDVQAVSGQYYAHPPPLPSHDVQTRNFSMAPNFMFPNPIEMGTFFGGDDGEELPPPPLPQDVQARVSGQYTSPPSPLDVQALDFPMDPSFMFSNPIEMDAFFGDGDAEELPPPPPPPLSPLSPLDVQASDFPMSPNFMFPDPTEMGSLFGDGEEFGGDWW